MRFAKYYNVTKLVDDMQKKEEIDTYPTEAKDKIVWRRIVCKIANETKFSLGDMNMITFKCLYKLTKEEVRGIVFDIKNGKSYTVLGWEDYYATDADIIEYYNSL